LIECPAVQGPTGALNFGHCARFRWPYGTTPRSIGTVSRSLAPVGFL
jgi:hypothetical protein